MHLRRPIKLRINWRQVRHRLQLSAVSAGTRKGENLSGYPGRAFRFRDSDDLTIATVAEGRLFLAGQRLYRVAVTYNAVHYLGLHDEAACVEFRQQIEHVAVERGTLMLKIKS